MEDDWISTAEAEQLSNYRQEHLARLCREGQLTCRKLARDWFIQRASLLAYLQDWHPDIYERITKQTDT